MWYWDNPAGTFYYRNQQVQMDGGVLNTFKMNISMVLKAGCLVRALYFELREWLHTDTYHRYLYIYIYTLVTQNYIGIALWFKYHVYWSTTRIKKYTMISCSLYAREKNSWMDPTVPGQEWPGSIGHRAYIYI